MGAPAQQLARAAGISELLATLLWQDQALSFDTGDDSAVDDEALVALSRGGVNRAGDVAGGGRADGAVDFDQANVTRLQGGRRPTGQSCHQD